jgi:hypothetical protein
MPPFDIVPRICLTSDTRVRRTRKSPATHKRCSFTVTAIQRMAPQRADFSAQAASAKAVPSTGLEDQILGMIRPLWRKFATVCSWPVRDPRRADLNLRNRGTADGRLRRVYDGEGRLRMSLSWAQATFSQRQLATLYAFRCESAMIGKPSAYGSERS